jgi:hypothetical protein
MNEELERLKNFILNNKGNAEMLLVQSLEDENKRLKKKLNYYLELLYKSQAELHPDFYKEI